MGKVSLYECFNAKVDGDKIHCAKGHQLGIKKQSMGINPLIRGASLRLAVCQNCNDFEPMGGPVPAGERGWSKK